MLENFRNGRTPRVAATTAYLPTCAIQSAPSQMPSNHDLPPLLKTSPTRSHSRCDFEAEAHPLRRRTQCRRSSSNGFRGLIMRTIRAALFGLPLCSAAVACAQEMHLSPEEDLPTIDARLIACGRDRTWVRHTLRSSLRREFAHRKRARSVGATADEIVQRPSPVHARC